MPGDVQVLTKWEVQSNPSAIGADLAKLAMEIQAAKDDINSIKERGLWQRLTNNNTRDLANAMLKQNDTISAFMVIVQGIISLSMSNVVILGGIMDAVNKAEKTNDLRDNSYIAFTKNYLSEALKVARKGEANTKEIKDIKAGLATAHERLDRIEAELKIISQQLNMAITDLKFRLGRCNDLYQRLRVGLIIAWVAGAAALLTSILTLVIVLT